MSISGIEYTEPFEQDSHLGKQGGQSEKNRTDSERLSSDLADFNRGPFKIRRVLRPCLMIEWKTEK